MRSSGTILNEHLKFTRLKEEDQDSFRRAPAAEHMQLPKGTRLYKWTSYPLVVWKGEGADLKPVISTFWSSMDGLKTPSGRVVPDFATVSKRFRNTGGGVGAPRDAARARLAVRGEWNTMNAVMFIQLDQLVWGFVGQAARQHLEKPRPVPDLEQLSAGKDQAKTEVSWIGGDWQVAIPGLTVAHCHRIG